MMISRPKILVFAAAMVAARGVSQATAAAPAVPTRGPSIAAPAAPCVSRADCDRRDYDWSGTRGRMGLGADPAYPEGPGNAPN